MLYASTRNSLTKTLGSTHFTDNLFATSKEDLTPEAYEAHKRHQNAPKPMSASEQEAAATRQAEKEASLRASSRTPVNHLGGDVAGLQWTPEVEEAVKDLGHSRGGSLLVIVSRAPRFLFVPCEITPSIFRRLTSKRRNYRLLRRRMSLGSNWDHRYPLVILVRLSLQS
jgi:hypothetical protein